MSVPQGLATWQESVSHQVFFPSGLCWESQCSWQRLPRAGSCCGIVWVHEQLFEPGSSQGWWLLGKTIWALFRAQVSSDFQQAEFSRWRREKKQCGRTKKVCRASDVLLASRASNPLAGPKLSLALWHNGHWKQLKWTESLFRIQYNPFLFLSGSCCGVRVRNWCRVHRALGKVQVTWDERCR